MASPSPDRFRLTGPSRRPDPRVNAYRTDIADIRLAEHVFAPHYARAEQCGCAADAATVHRAPSADSVAVTQLLPGEGFEVLDREGGWAWGRCAHDSYVGYVAEAALARPVAATHRIAIPLALVFAHPDIKAPVVARLPVGACFAGEEQGEFVACDMGFVHLRHATPVDAVADPVAIAERLVGLPYLWGGRGAGGIDCSGLVQVALAAAGIATPRDSDQQRALGHEVTDDLRRGDLVCFPGHIGIMADATRLIHANAHWMAVTVEPLADVVARIADAFETPILARRRIA